MVNIEMLASLLVFAATATFSPGGATVIAVASGARFGLRRSIPVLLGIASGLTWLSAIAGAGLGSLLQTLPQLQVVMRGAGSVYLLWLSWRIAQSGAPDSTEGEAATPLGYANGLLLLSLNPKAWTVAFGAAAAFATLASNSLHLALILAAVIGSCAILSLSLWCVGGQALARLLHTDLQWRILNCVLALLLVASIVAMWL